MPRAQCGMLLFLIKRPAGDGSVYIWNYDFMREPLRSKAKISIII